MTRTAHPAHPNTGRRFLLATLAAAVACSVAMPLTPAAAAPITPQDPTAAPGTYTSQNLAADRTAANFYYRIPALAHLGGGVVLASWDARPGSSADAPNPNSIVQRRSTDNGVTWGPMTTVAAGHTAAPKDGYSDPSYVVDAVAGKVFAFFVYSKDAGFGGSQYGNDDANRNVISSAVVESTDGGVSWSAPRLITNVTKPGNTPASPQPGDVRTNFAASGEGIQLKYGAYAGRLIQQYSGMVRQANGSEAFQAYSVYSDDHGATWQRGVPVGTGMDENKVVELSDGRVMLNSRDSAGSKFRKVAISTDGGHTYGPVTLDRQLIDPTNNGSITRLFPDAAAGSADAKKILFTNSASQTARENVSARVSCDDGRTWPGFRTLAPGSSAYSTATRLDNGRIGVFYEKTYDANMQFASVDDAWLNYVCAPLSAADTSLQAGSTKTIPVTVTNQESTELSGGTVTINVPSGWTAPTVNVPTIAPGASVTVDVPLTAPANATGSLRLAAVFRAADGRTSTYDIVTTPTGAQTIGGTLVFTPPTRDVVTNPYRVGERLTFTLRVTSTSTVATDAVPTAGNLETGLLPTASPNCRWLNLAANAAYNCTTPSHVLTQEEVDRGWFTPSATFTFTSRTNPSASTTVTSSAAPVLLRAATSIAPAATITGARTDTGRDLATSPYAVGEEVPYAFDVTSTVPFAETIAPTTGSFAPFVPPGTGNCRWTNLAAFATYRCVTPRHAVTQEEADQGFFAADTTWTATADTRVSTIAVPGGEVDVKVRQPALSATVLAELADTDGDRYASVGDVMTFTATIGNAGNTSLTDLSAPGSHVTATALALGESVDGTWSYALTQADLDRGSITVPGLTATAANGSLAVGTSAEEREYVFDVKPAKPTSTPQLTVKDYSDRTPPIDLGLDKKYRAGSLVVANGLEYGQWYYLYLNKRSVPLGWFFPTLDNTIEVVLPETTGNGADQLVILDSHGNEVTFGKYIVTPKGR